MGWIIFTEHNNTSTQNSQPNKYSQTRQNSNMFIVSRPPTPKDKRAQVSDKEKRK